MVVAVVRSGAGRTFGRGEVSPRHLNLRFDRRCWGFVA